LSRNYVVWSVAPLVAVEIPSTTGPASTMTSPMLLPALFLLHLINAVNGSAKSRPSFWRGRHDRRSIHGHRHTQTDHFRRTDGNQLRATGAIK